MVKIIPHFEKFGFMIAFKFNETLDLKIFFLLDTSGFKLKE